MANIKKITLDTQTLMTVYCIMRRESDGYLLNDADGAFASGPADPYVAMAEHSVIKGRYELSESRAAWNDGAYTVAIYRQSGASPSPAADTIIGTAEMYVKNDSEIMLDESVATRATAGDIAVALGILGENAVEDDIVRNAAGLKTSSIIYVYDTKAHATTHDKATGLIAKLSAAATYDTANRLILSKRLKEV